MEATTVARDDLEPRHAWILTHKTHQDICDSIRTPKQLEEFMSILTTFQHKLAEENSPDIALPHRPGVASLPPSQTRTFEPRRAKLHSPKKKRRKHGNPPG
jgi:hypothetical protein